MQPLELTPSPLSVALFAAGWSAGWLLLARPRRLPVPHAARRVTVAVVIPARNEAGSIAAIVGDLTGQLRPDDQLVVVDDGSVDGTGDVARGAGADVIAAPALPDGWAGKPHAAAAGAAATGADLLAFVDADVRLGGDVVDAVAEAVTTSPATSRPAGGLVSVQPWHTPGSAVEQLSLVFNLAALMGCGAFALRRRAVASPVAFGPLVATSRDTYDRIGGHAAPGVRAAILEDIALARSAGGALLFVGRPGEVEFRMYPRGWREFAQGWTKGLGIAIAASPRWSSVATAAWITSLAGGWLASPWFWIASTIQLLVLGRIAGRFSPWIAVVHPLSTATFVALFVRSVLRRVLRRDVTWKDRRLRPDQPTALHDRSSPDR